MMSGGSLDFMLKFVYIQIYIAIGVGAITVMFYFMFNAFSAVLAYKVRIKYFQRCLEMDASFYDE